MNTSSAPRLARSAPRCRTRASARQVDGEHDADHRQREQQHQARRRAPRGRLAFEEVHATVAASARARGTLRRRADDRSVRTAPSAPRACACWSADLEQRGRREVEHAGEDAGREHLAPVVVGHHRVVEGLARERDPVLGGGQLLGELHHVLVGLEVRIGLGHRHQPAQRAIQRALRRRPVRAIAAGSPGLALAADRPAIAAPRAAITASSVSRSCAM